MRVTFDTNVCDVIHTPSKWPAVVDPAVAEKIRDAILCKKIDAFVSEATLFVECLSFEDKLTYLSVVGTSAPRPEPDTRRIDVFSYLASLGVRLLHAPLIAGEKFFDGMEWADDAVYSRDDRQERFSKFSRQYPRHSPLEEIGNELLKTQAPPPLAKISFGNNSVRMEKPAAWAVAIKREWEASTESDRKNLRRKVGPIIGEWCDALIVGSHFAYGNDVFCTADQGKGSGSDSLLFHGNRGALRSSGVNVVSPEELLHRISNPTLPPGSAT